MKNIPVWARGALRLRRRLLRHGGVGEALSSFSPVGWCAAGDGVSFGGKAIMGETPVAADTVFRVASVSKLFGAAAAMALVREGRLALDAPSAEVLGFSTGRDITLRQLLTHTAALSDAAYDRAVGMEPLPPLEAVLADSRLGYASGARFRYSNLGAGVVGMLVEAASGMLFDDYVRQVIFEPLGIDASFHPQRIVHRERMANCYRVPGRTLAYDAQAIAAMPLDVKPNPSRHYGVPAGKLMISAPDLATCLRYMARTWPEMFVRQAHIGSVTCDAGRGLGPAWMPPGIIAPRGLWGHQGVAYGALCEAWIDPADGTCAVVLTNGARLAKTGPLYHAGQAAVAALLDRDPREGV